MWISVAFLAVLATVSAAPQELLEYEVEGVGGPGYKVINSNSGFSIESSNGARSIGSGVSSHSSSSQSSSSFGAQSGFGLNAGEIGNSYRSAAVNGQSAFSGLGSESLSGLQSVTGVDSHLAAHNVAVNHPAAQRSYISSYESKSSSLTGGLVGAPQLSTVFNGAQSGASADSGSDSIIVKQQSVKSFETQPEARLFAAPVSTAYGSQASNSQVYGNSNVHRASGVSYNAGLARPLAAVAYQSGHATRSNAGASNYGTQSNNGYYGAQSVAGQYGYGRQSQGSSTSQNYGSQQSGVSVQKAASFNGQKSVSGSSGVGSLASQSGLLRGSSAGNYGLASGSVSGTYSSGIHSGSSGVGSLASQSGLLRSSSASNYGLASGSVSGTYSSGIQRGNSGVAQRTNAVYGVQPYAAAPVQPSAAAVFNPVASSVGVQSVKSSLSKSGSSAYSGSVGDVSGSVYRSSLVSSQPAQSVYSSQQSGLQYGVKLGNTAQSAAQKSTVSGLAARSDAAKYAGLYGAQSGSYFGARSGVTNLGVESVGAQSVGSVYGARSGSLYGNTGSHAYGSSSGVQSAAARQASYNANAAGAASSALGYGGSTLQNSYIIKQDQDQADDGSHYNYSYDADNGISVQSSGGVKEIGSDHETQVMSGSYSYLGDDGQTYTVNYIADENGFQPQGAHLHPIPEEIQRSIEYNMAHPEEITIQ